MRPEELSLRPATLDDARRLWNWRNDLDTRMNSVTQQKVPWESHLTWLNTSLRNPSRILLIAEERGVPVGTVRYDLRQKPSDWELSWTVAPEARGQGVGTRLVAEALRAHSGQRLWARIKSENRASIAIAEKVGLQFSHREEELLWFVYEATAGRSDEA